MLNFERMRGEEAAKIKQVQTRGRGVQILGFL